VNKSRRRNNEHSYLSLTKWLIYLSLLIGGVALLIDLVVVINTFLNGEITARFIYKALAVLIVIGAAFYYYLLDARGFWIKNEKKSITYGAVAAAIVLLAVILGFMNIKAPADVREQKLDQTQITDLQQIQWQIQDHLILNGSLPESLDNLTESSKVPLPSAPEEREAYRYELTEQGFQLCATFAAASRSDEFLYSRPFAPTNEAPTILNPDNWEHGEGEVCFERVVTTRSE
jgi:hypothetical protein